MWKAQMERGREEGRGERDWGWLISLESSDFCKDCWVEEGEPNRPTLIASPDPKFFNSGSSVPCERVHYLTAKWKWSCGQIVEVCTQRLPYKHDPLHFRCFQQNPEVCSALCNGKGWSAEGSRAHRAGWWCVLLPQPTAQPHTGSLGLTWERTEFVDHVFAPHSSWL